MGLAVARLPGWGWIRRPGQEAAGDAMPAGEDGWQRQFERPFWPWAWPWPPGS